MIVPPTRQGAIRREIGEREPEEWPAWLEAECGGDAALRDEILSLLAAHGEGGSLLSEPLAVPADADSSLADTLLGQRLGPYEVQRRLGGGGLGNVYLASGQG